MGTCNRRIVYRNRSWDVNSIYMGKGAAIGGLFANEIWEAYIGWGGRLFIDILRYTVKPY